MTSRDHLGEINQFESHYNYDSRYMRELLSHNPQAYAKFDSFMPLASHREALDVNSYWVAKLAAMRVEDCGQCLQLNVRMAQEGGVENSIIGAVLNNGDGLPQDLKPVFEYATLVAQRSPICEPLQQRIQQQFNQAQMLEFALCVATAGVFPAIKRSLGYAKSCSVINISL